MSMFDQKVYKKVTGAVLPGNSTVEFAEFDIPMPGHGEMIVQVKASTICGSDIRCIYKEHLGVGAEGYQKGLICGHEPCGIVVAAGKGLRRYKVGDRVVIYHVSGCGVCNDCRRGYMNSCTNDDFRKAYGWQRNGGMAPYMMVEEKDCVLLPDNLSFLDGAQVACSYGTVYEGLEKIGISGNDAVLVMGLGPVGMAALQLCRALGAKKLIGVDLAQERLDLAMQLGILDHPVVAHPDNVAQIKALTGGMGCERTIDCTGNRYARLTAIKACRKWGKICFIGEGSDVQFHPSDDLMHEHKSIHGSWVTTIWKMEELLERISRWGIRPELLVTHKFKLEEAPQAYATMNEGKCGKVAVVFD